MKDFRLYEIPYYIPGHTEAVEEIRDYAFVDESLINPQTNDEFIRIQLWYDLLVGREQMPWMVECAERANETT